MLLSVISVTVALKSGVIFCSTELRFRRNGKLGVNLLECLVKTGELVVGIKKKNFIECKI